MSRRCMGILVGLSLPLARAVALDYNADSKPDLLWRQKVNGSVAFWFMNGTTFQAAGYLTNSAAQQVGVGDPNWKYDRNASGPVSLSEVELVSGIDLEPEHSRGRLLLLVDNTLAGSLSAELNNLKTNLVGDGWTVIRHDVARHNDTTWSANPPQIQAIKSLVVSNYNAAPGQVKGIFIVGHVAIPYSGTSPGDGHWVGPNHAGAWPSDAYFGYINGVWQADIANAPNTELPDNDNDPGDGKLDEEDLPASLELFVSRIDFARLPAFTTVTPIISEVDLLKRYLDKAHRFRWRQAPYPLPSQAIAWGSWNGGSPEATDAYPYTSGINRRLYSAALRSAAACFPVPGSSLTVGDACFQTTKSYLVGFVTGPGLPDRIHDKFPQLEHTTSWLKILASGPPVAFWFPYGSYFGDHNMIDNFLRATLAMPQHGLGAAWPYFGFALHGMAMGETLGDAMLRVARRPGKIFEREYNLHGDPTLRLETVAAPTGVTLQAVSGSVQVSWAAPEPGLGYHVYFAQGTIDGVFQRLTTGQPVSGTSYTHTSAPSGTKTYMVRSIKSVTSGSGRYKNLRQGSVAWVTQ